MQEFIKTLNIDDYIAFRAACIRVCNISRAQWSNWRKGKVAVPVKYHDTINNVSESLFGTKVFEEK